MHPCSNATRVVRAVLVSACGTMVLLGLAAAALGQTTTLHGQYQAVTSTGYSAWTTTGTVVMTGVVINNPGDMLDYSAASPQWQVYFQATENAKTNDGDFGGTAMYLRRYHPGSAADLFPDASTPIWGQEMERLNYPVYTVTGSPITEPLRRGDLIQVTANAPGMFYNGKKNINSEHKGPGSSYEDGESYEDYLFSIALLQRDVALTASQVSLSDLKDGGDNFIFDATRATGCEHYQGSLVHLENLLLDNPGNWALDDTVTVRQGELTFPMKLGIDSDLLSINYASLATTPFSVTAVLDQESSNPQTGYRLWLTNVSDLTTGIVPEPGTGLLVLAGLLALPPRRRRDAECGRC